MGPAAVERIAVRRDHGEKRPEKTEGESNEARGGASEQRDGKKQATTTARALELARLVSYLFLFDCNLWFSFFSFSLPPLSLSHPLLPLLLPLSLSYSLNQATSGNRTDVVAKKKINVAINGFGRIGRNFLRCVEGRGPESLLNVTVINDSGGVKQASHLLKYDSTLGTFNADVRIVDDSTISVNGKPIKIVSSRDPTQLPWAAENIDLVIEGTGVFISSEGAGKHLQAGAKKVLITAPAKGVSLLLFFCFRFRRRMEGEEGRWKKKKNQKLT